MSRVNGFALAAMASMPDVSVLVFDAEMRYQAVLGGATLRDGYQGDMLLGRRAREVLPDEVWQRLRSYYDAALAGETVTAFVDSRDGTAVYETVFSPVREGGRIVGGMVVSRDITAQRDATAALEEREGLLRLITANASDVICRVDLEGRYTYVSPAAVRTYGWEPDELVGDSAFDRIHPDDQSDIRARQAELLAGADGAVMEYRYRRRDGSWLWVEGRGRPVWDDAGTVVGLQTSVRDISLRKRREAELAETRALFEQAFAKAPIGMALVAPDGRWLKVNAALCEVTGRDETALLAGAFQDITHPDDLDTDVALAGEVLAGRMQDYQMEKRYVRPDGSVVWVLLSVSLARDSREEPRFLIAQVIDISSRKDVEARLRHQASHDALTGLWNRGRMQEELDWWFAESRRYNEPAVLLAIDLDGFKAINDSYGHQAGDAYLRNVATRMQALLRDSDRCARMGGDEFTVLLPYATVEEGRRVAERIVTAVAATTAGEVPGGMARASVGVAELGGRRSASEWLRAADAAMYDAKRAGGSRTAMTHSTRARAERAPRRRGSDG